MKTLSCWGQLNNHKIITETSYPKPTNKTFTLHYKYGEPANPICRQLCAETLALQIIVRGISPNFGDLLGGLLVCLETSKIRNPAQGSSRI